jgi:hypothetical protein
MTAPTQAQTDADALHGHAPADIHQLALEALRADRWRTARDLDERYAAALHAITEHLCTAQDPPTHTDLLDAGVRASHAVIRGADQAHGHDRAGDTRPRFAAYWETAARHTPGPEDCTVERRALVQIWRALTPGHREALWALYETGDRHAAAVLIGLSDRGFGRRLHNARIAAAALWHEQETPRPIGRPDRRPGARNGQWKGRPRLTESQVDQLRERYHAGGTTYTSLAAETGITPDWLSQLIRGTRPAAPDPPQTA